MTLDLTSFKQALVTLDTGLKMLAHKPNDEFVRDACVQRFEYCYELSHKSLRRYLQASEATAADVPSASFPALIRLGYQRGLLASDWERWNETFAKRLFLPPALLANTHLFFINSALPSSWEQKIALFAGGLGIVQNSQNKFSQARNTTSHTYDSAAADRVLQILPAFLLEANFLLRQIELRQEQG